MTSSVQLKLLHQENDDLTNTVHIQMAMLELLILQSNLNSFFLSSASFLFPVLCVFFSIFFEFWTYFDL